jgi:hypothetical protein
LLLLLLLLLRNWSLLEHETCCCCCYFCSLKTGACLSMKRATVAVADDVVAATVAP